MFSQLGRYPPALATVAVLMALFALVPGLPFVPFIGGAILLGTASELVRRKAAALAAEAAKPKTNLPALPAERPIGDVLDLDDMHVEFASDLVNMVLDPGIGLDARIGNMRRHVASSFGLILPEIRLTDDASLPAGTYVIRIQGVEQARDRLRPERVLAIDPGTGDDLPDGIEVREPVYGAPARWIANEAQDRAALAGMTVVTPTEVLATHLLEVMKRNFGRLLTLKALRRLLDEVVNLTDTARAEANRKLLAELIPDKVPVDLLLTVMRMLLEERVSIRNWPLILESIAEVRGVLVAPEAICEHVRQRLGFQLVAELRRADGTLPLVQLAPEWEETFLSYQIGCARRAGRCRAAARGVQPAGAGRGRAHRPRRRKRRLSGGGHLDPAAAVPAHGAVGQGHPEPGAELRRDRIGRAAGAGGHGPGMNDLAQALGISQDMISVALVVFLRVGAAMALLPAFGEQSVPQRVRLFLGLAFTVVVAPAVAGPVAAGLAAPGAFPGLWISEPAIGLAFGLSLRLAVMALQIAGTIAAQSTSLSQAFSAAGVEPSPVVGQMLMMAGLALAVTAGLHLRLAAALIDTYQLFPPGTWPSAQDLLGWGVGRISATFALAFALAMPFVIAALVYNVALGIINRAMPALMVTFIGAPALTAGGLLMLIAALPAILHVWMSALSDILAQPF